MDSERGQKTGRQMPPGAAPKKTNRRTLITALVLAGTAAALSVAASAAEPRKFGDWVLRCESPGKGKSDVCYLNQTLNITKGKVKGRLLDVKIGTFGKGKDVFAVLMLPLGLSLQKGAALQVDDAKQVPLTIQTCTKAGCRSQLKMTDELLAGFRKGTKLKIGFIPFPGKRTVVVEASLTGFTAAYKALEKR